MYSPVRVSMRITSPSLMKSGTRTTAPVSSFAGFWPPVAVSPRSPGSVSMTFSSMCGGGVLLEALRHHEVPEVPVLVEILHVGIDDVSGLERLAGLEGALDGAAGLEIAHLDAIERLALAGLHELVLDHRVGFAVEQHLQTAADLAGRVAGHVS